MKITQPDLGEVSFIIDHHAVAYIRIKIACIPFGTVVERGLLPVGTVLSDPTGRFTAKVRADGTLISSDYRGSIHQVGAAVQGAPACNGWTFWHVRMGKSLVAIDMLRQKVRAEMGPALQ